MARRRTTIGRWLLFGAGVFLYLGTLAIAAIATQGLFGTSPDAFGAVFLIFVGLPWSLIATPIALADWPGWIGLGVIVLAPLVNLFLLWKLLFGARDKA